MISVFKTSRKVFFLSPFRTVLSAIHMQVTDRPSVTGCPVSNPGNNCANGLLKADPGFLQFHASNMIVSAPVVTQLGNELQSQVNND